jgi:hypothetical protein
MSFDLPYNPLDKVNLGKSVAEALLGRAPQPLEDLGAFAGAGIYALYYHGPHKAYQRIAALNQDDDPQAPVYVGKAIPAGARKGVTISAAPVQAKVMFRRLIEHAESLKSTSTLALSDFRCRWLTVDDIWIPLGESLLIATFSPVWNTLVDGFGNHDPGSGRYGGLRPRWDVLHTGRAWADRCKPSAETAAQIQAEVIAWLNTEPTLARSRFLVEQAQARKLLKAGKPADMQNSL